MFVYLRKPPGDALVAAAALLGQHVYEVRVLCEEAPLGGAPPPHHGLDVGLHRLREERPQVGPDLGGVRLGGGGAVVVVGLRDVGGLVGVAGPECLIVDLEFNEVLMELDFADKCGAY